MPIQIENKIFKWLRDLQILSDTDTKQSQKSTLIVNENTINQFENAVKVGEIIIQLYKKKGIPIPNALNHLKSSNQTAAKLYNWNSINEALKKFGFQIDSESKNFIINGDYAHLRMVLRKLYDLYQSEDQIDDSLETLKQKQPKKQPIKQSLSLSYSNEVQIKPIIHKPNQPNSNQDLLQFILTQLTKHLKLTRKQAVALLSQNNKYLAHVLVKGVKGQFTDIEQLMQTIYKSLDYIVEKMVEQNDMCFFFLQVIKPSLLSKSEDVAQWGCRILSKVGFELANKQMLPLAYDWFVRDAGGLSTTLLALNRHPKLSQHVVGFILQFARYNVTELFTIELKKITNNDDLTYMKFVLLIFDSLIQSKTSAQELLSSGAIDYWVQMSMKGAQAQIKNSQQLRLICIQLLIKIWKAYPSHIQQSLDQVNAIMANIKRGIRQNSQIMKFILIEMLFNLLDQFANNKNPYASIVYKKLTFLFIENHQEGNIRQFMLRNFQNIFQKYQTIPVEIFLQPFIKQIKISESKSYLVNIFDFQFIGVAVEHKKLKTSIALELYDLLAKIKLNSYSFSKFADESMNVLLDRFLQEDIFLQYTVKLVKISLAMFYSTLKNKKQFDDQERLQAQKRAQIVNFIISLIERANNKLTLEIKQLVIHVKVQIYNKIGIKHKGIERILSYFNGIQEQVQQALQNTREQLQSNATSTKSKNDFHLPKIQKRKQRDQTSSQQSFKSSSSKISRQQFPAKDYTAFVTQDQQKLLKENGIQMKKKPMSKAKRIASYQKDVDPKLQQQILKIKEKRELELQKKAKENLQILKKKELLKINIQKQLQHRNLKQGHKGIEKDVQVQVIFAQNQIQQNILEDDEQAYKNILPFNDQDRNTESIKLVLKKHSTFIKKVFGRYCIAKMGKKEYFEEQSECMNQVDLLRMCKEKNLQKNKQTIIELLKIANDKDVNNIQINGFIKFLQILCMSLAYKQRVSSHIPLGQFMKQILQKIAVNQKFKLQQEEDQITKNYTQKVRYNPHIQLPQGYKKIYERVTVVSHKLTYPVIKSNSNQSYFICFEALNDIIHKIFEFHIIEEEIGFRQQARVVTKKQSFIPPKPLKKQKQQGLNVNLQQVQKVPQTKAKINTYSNKSLSKKPNLSLEKDNSNQQKKPIINAAEKKRIQQQEQKRRKKQQEEQSWKIRQGEVKKKLQAQQQERQRQKSKKKQQEKEQQKKQLQRLKKEKEEKQKYRKEQKQKLQKYKRQQQEKQKQQKEKNKKQREKQQQQKKQKYKLQNKKQQEKRKQQYQKHKKQKQLEIQRQKQKKEQQERKKQQIKKQVFKKLENQKQKYQTYKLQKQILKKIYHQENVTQIFNKYKEEMKSLFNYGTQYNEHKIQQINQSQIGQKGWLTICQQLLQIDTSTAILMLKQHMKQSKQNGYSFDGFQEQLLGIAVKKQLEKQAEDFTNLKNICGKKLDSYLNSLKIPKQKQRIKQFFVLLKNNKNKEQIAVIGPNGEKQTWEINQ